MSECKVHTRPFSWSIFTEVEGVVSLAIPMEKELYSAYQCQWRIQDFPEEGAPTPGEGGRQHTILPNFPKSCMKLKEFGPGGSHPSRPPLRSATEY